MRWFFGEDWFLGGGDEEFEDDGFSLEGDFSLGGDLVKNICI